MHKLDRHRRANAVVSDAHRSDQTDESFQAPVLQRGTRRPAAAPEPQTSWPENVRFSRTPDRLRKAAAGEQAQAVAVFADAEAVAVAAPAVEFRPARTASVSGARRTI
ncbi:hypothetical protein [Bosea thiooxidans]